MVSLFVYVFLPDVGGMMVYVRNDLRVYFGNFGIVFIFTVCSVSELDLLSEVFNRQLTCFMHLV